MEGFNVGCGDDGNVECIGMTHCWFGCKEEVKGGNGVVVVKDIPGTLCNWLSLHSCPRQFVCHPMPSPLSPIPSAIVL